MFGNFDGSRAILRAMKLEPLELDGPVDVELDEVVGLARGDASTFSMACRRLLQSYACDRNAGLSVVTAFAIQWHGGTGDFARVSATVVSTGAAATSDGVRATIENLVSTGAVIVGADGRLATSSAAADEIALVLASDGVMQSVASADESIISAVSASVDSRSTAQFEATCDLMLRVRLGAREPDHWKRTCEEVPMFRENVDDGRYSTALVLVALHSSIKRLEIN